MKQQTHTLIIGGGFSGITAAKKLSEAGIPFELLEARDRLGGRTHTRFHADGSYLEMGGQWIGPTQERMYALAKEIGVEWYPTYNEGINQIDLNHKIRHYRGLIPKIDVLSLLSLELLIRKMERLARQINTQAPWSTPQASKWDSITLDQFVRKNTTTKNAQKVIRAGLETVFACELNEISLLHALFYIRSGTSLNHLLNINGGAQQHRLHGGMQPFAERLAAPFRNHIHFNKAVKIIDWSAQQAVVSGEGFSISAKRVIMAIPPVLVPHIQFTPALPLQKSQLLSKMSMGIVGKVFAVYEKPFWRSSGYSGQVVADEHSPFQTLFDASPDNGNIGVLLAFCIAKRAHVFFAREETERQKMALATFTKYFGSEAAHPVRYADHCWADEIWSRGCYAGLYPTGSWTTFQGMLAKSCGALHWAGTETSSEWYGYIEGAVRAGERAADEVIKSMEK